MTSLKFYFQNALILALNSEKCLEIATTAKYQLDPKNSDRYIGN